jgi:transcriptional regulator with XRE-family HTH domain
MVSIVGMDIRALFGGNLRRFRKAAGLSQEALAVRMGVDRAHVSSMERGLQNVTLLTIWAASEALAIQSARLLEEGESRSSVRPEVSKPGTSQPRKT